MKGQGPVLAGGDPVSSAIDPPWPSPARSWWMIAVFFAAAILSYTDRFILSLLVDPVRADLHISDTQVSLLQGLAFALVYSFAGLPLGRIADLMPRRNVIIAGVVIWSSATAACGFANSFAALFAARVGVGVGEAALAPAAISMIADCFPPSRRGTALSVFIAGMAIGGGAAIAIGGSLLGAASLGIFRMLPLVGTLPPWRATLVLLALPGVLIIALLLTVHEPSRRATNGPGSAGPLPLRAAFAAFQARGYILVPLYLAVALVSAGDFSFQNWTPALLSRRFGLSPIQIGQQLGLMAILSGVGGTLAAGLLGDLSARHGTERTRLTLALGAIIVGLAGASIVLAVTANQVLLCFVVWLSMASAAEALGVAVLQAVIPGEVRGIGVACVSFCNMLFGLACGTALTAAFTDHVFHDPRSVAGSMTAVAVPAALIAIALFFRVRRQWIPVQPAIRSAP
jgi:MFS family permease